MFSNKKIGNKRTINDLNSSLIMLVSIIFLLLMSSMIQNPSIGTAYASLPQPQSPFSSSSTSPDDSFPSRHLLSYSLLWSQIKRVVMKGKEKAVQSRSH